MFEKNMQKDEDSAIDHKCEKIRHLTNGLKYTEEELRKVKIEEEKLQYQLAKQKAKNKKAGLEPVKVYAEYKPFDEIVNEIKQEIKEVEKEATGKELILAGLAKTLLEVIKAGDNFEINIQEEHNTGILGQRLTSGREIATIRYPKHINPTGRGTISFKGGK